MIPRTILVLKPHIEGGTPPVEPPTVYTVTGFINPGGEAKNNIGWTKSSEQTPYDPFHGIADSNLARHPPLGTFFFLGNNATIGIQYQDITLATQTTVPLAKVDAGQCWIRLTWWAGTRLGGVDTDKPAIDLRFYDGSSVLLDSATTGLASPVTDRGGGFAWDAQMHEFAVPVGTRKVRVMMRMVLLNGTFNDAAIDEIVPTFLVYN